MSGQHPLNLEGWTDTREETPPLNVLVEGLWMEQVPGAPTPAGWRKDYCAHTRDTGGIYPGALVWMGPPPAGTTTWWHVLDRDPSFWRLTRIL